MSAVGRTVLTLLTDDPALARRADAAGIDRVGLDLERIGKQARQDPDSCWISDHQLDSLPLVAAALTRAAPFARTNPIHEGSPSEIEALLAAGARVLMLPMFRTPAEVERFVTLVDGRALAVPLVETADAARDLAEILQVDGIDEIHVGLNDLHLDLGLRSHFELLISPLLDRVAEAVHRAGLPLGIGAVARVGDEGLPVPPRLVCAQLGRLGATRSLVARSLLGPDPDAIDLPVEIAAVREALARAAGAAPLAQAQARGELEIVLKGLSGR